MADLSQSFDPSSIATTSDAASSALALATTTSDAASSALALASDAASKASVASVAAAGVASQASDASSAAVVAVSKASDASSAYAVHQRTVILKVFNDGSEVTAGDGAMYFTIPNTLSGMNLVSCGAHVYSSAASNKVQIQIHNKTSAVDMLTSMMEIDVGELDTTTASSQATISAGTDGVVAGEEIRVDVSAAGSSCLGLEVRLTFQKP